MRTAGAVHEQCKWCIGIGVLSLFLAPPPKVALPWSNNMAGSIYGAQGAAQSSPAVMGGNGVTNCSVVGRLAHQEFILGAFIRGQHVSEAAPLEGGEARSFLPEIGFWGDHCFFLAGSLLKSCGSTTNRLQVPPKKK